MLHVLVSLAFLRAFLAGIRAKLAELRGAFAAALHQERGSAAKLGTFEVEGDAAGQHLHVLFLEAGVGAVFAFECAFVASIDAAAHGFV
jgi:hypothetical protein